MHIHRIINSVFTSNTYILTNENRDAFLIDIGDIQPVKEFIEVQGGKIKAVFLTHVHYDHIYGIRELISMFPDCIIYTSSFGKRALASDKLNFSRYHDDSILWNGDNVEILHEDTKIEIFPNKFIEVFETPGHDKSCLTYKLVDNVFSGDSYIPGVKVIASFPHSDREDAEISKRRIVKLAEGHNLYPGHGDAYIHYNSHTE